MSKKRLDKFRDMLHNLPQSRENVFTHPIDSKGVSIPVEQKG